MSWKGVKCEIPSFDAEVRWTIEPENLLARKLWRFLDFTVSVEWVYLMMKKSKEELEDTATLDKRRK